MKNNYLLPIITAIIIAIMFIVFFLSPKNNSVYSSVTLDINPSIEINLDKDEKIISINPLNDDAKDLVTGEEKGTSLSDYLHVLVDKMIEKNYFEDSTVTILMSASENFNKEDFEHNLNGVLNEKNLFADIIVIDNITEEDEAYAKEHNISPSKAAYINSIAEGKDNIDKDSLIEKPLRELKETKEFGRYCDDEYKLEGEFCVREIAREKAESGQVCPRNYIEIKGKCYEETGVLEKDEYYCEGDLTLRGQDCVRTVTDTVEPEYECDKGELKRGREISNRYYKGDVACVDSTNAKAPTLRCMIGPHIVIGGKCYVGPAPTINGGCPGNDVLRNGGCYSLDPEDQWQCPDGNIYEKSKGSYVDICPDTLTYTKPKIKGYTCRDGFTLKDKKCIKEEVEPARRIRYCPNGFTKTKEDKCINYNNIKELEDGYRCEKEDTRVEGTDCVTYETKEAYQY